MNTNEILRIILIAGFLLVFPIAAYHRIKSQATGEKLDRRQEGLFILISIRLAGLAGLVGIVTWMVNPSRMAWASLPLPIWLRWVGVGIGALAGVFLVWTLRSLGKNLTDTVVTRKDHTLVTHGPYRWIRHPFYVSVALFFLSISLITANWFIFLSGVTLLTLLVIRTRKEEEKLLERFGDPYRAYTEQTGRFLPRR